MNIHIYDCIIVNNGLQIKKIEKMSTLQSHHGPSIM